MPDLFVRFDEWNAGHAGRIDPAMAPKNAWYGRNVQMYPSGLVGPRWGFRKVAVNAPGGAPLTIPVANGPKGFATVGDKLLVAADKTYIGSLATLASTGTVTTQALGPYTGTPNTWVTYVPQTNDIVMALVDNALYKHVLSALTTAAVSTPATFSFIRRWNLYCVAVDKNVPYRLWFSQISAAGFDFSIWPVGNFLDVGDQEPITAIVPIYNTLYVGKRSGWWAITGVIGTSSNIRAVSLGDGPVDPRGAGSTADNRVAYWPRSPNPAFFNGNATSLLLDHVSATYNPTAAQAVAAVPTGRTTVFGYDDGTSPTSSGILSASVGAVSVHEFDLHIAGWAPDVINNGYGMPAGFLLAARQTAVVGEQLAVYFWKVDPDHPRLSSDFLGAYGDGSLVPLKASLQTRGWYDPNGREVRVRNVAVRFRAWGIGEAPSNKLSTGFGISVQRFGPYDDRSDTSEVQHWAAPFGDLSVDGEDLLQMFQIGDQGYSAGFRVNVTDMQGVAIRDIVVGIDAKDRR